MKLASFTSPTTIAICRDIEKRVPYVEAQCFRDELHFNYVFATRDKITGQKWHMSFPESLEVKDDKYFFHLVSNSMTDQIFKARGTWVGEYLKPGEIPKIKTFMDELDEFWEEDRKLEEKKVKAKPKLKESYDKVKGFGEF